MEDRKHVLKLDDWQITSLESLLHAAVQQKGKDKLDRHDREVIEKVKRQASQAVIF